MKAEVLYLPLKWSVLWVTIRLNMIFNFDTERWIARFLVLTLPLWAVACATSAQPLGAAPHQGDLTVAYVHAHNCGRCHMAPEPKSRTRQELESAFARHRARVRLSEDEWGRLFDYLAQGDSGPSGVE